MRASSQVTPGQSVAQTHWSEFHAARTASPERRREVLDGLARRYRRPVYLYLRAWGLTDADADDLTQGFFAEIVLGRDLFGRADQSRGRFRPYLLHCLKNFLREAHRNGRARGRAPSRPLLSLSQLRDSGPLELEPPHAPADPEHVFDRAWAVSLLEQVIDRLDADCRADGLDLHYRIFQQRFIRPALEGTAAPSLESVADRVGLSRKETANRAETVRRRFRRLLLHEIRRTVADERTAEDELRALLASLGTGRGQPGPRHQ